MSHNKKTIYLIGFLYALHLALVSYVNSSFLSTFFSEKKVGLIYVFAAILAIITLLFIPKILRRIGGFRFLLYTSLFNSLALFCLSLIKSAFVIIPIFAFYYILNTLIVFSLDELLEITSENGKIGRTRGIYLTIINLGWILAQAFSYKILVHSSLNVRYALSFIVMFIVFLICLFRMHDMPDPKYDRVPAIKSIGKFFKNKNLARSYKINFLLQFFYSWMVIYTPIYLFSHLGFNWSEISLIFMIMLIPFVLFQFPIGKYSDKAGERKILMLGFLIAAIATSSLFFIKSHSIWIWAALLFTTRIGAAMIEVMSDSYFFKHITKENDEFIGFYRNTAEMSYILAPLLAFGIFYFIPSFNFIFLILGTLMLYGIYLSSTIEKSDI